MVRVSVLRALVGSVSLSLLFEGNEGAHMSLYVLTATQNLLSGVLSSNCSTSDLKEWIQP